MKVRNLIGKLLECDQDLEVRAEFGEPTNYWVCGVEQRETGTSGYELEGEVILNVSE